MFMLRQTSVKMAVLLHKQASDRFHSLLTVSQGAQKLQIKGNQIQMGYQIEMDRPVFGQFYAI